MSISKICYCHESLPMWYEVLSKANVNNAKISQEKLNEAILLLNNSLQVCYI